jgi:uncharacterized protein (TIGR00375 family)
MKGLNVMTVSDFTHPVWFREISTQLEEVQPGVYRYKKYREVEEANAALFKREFIGPYFVLTTELSCMYSEFGRGRRVHVIVCAPGLEVVAKINKEFLKRGFNLLADGRPILGISLRNLAELLFEIDPTIAIIPAHAWTPWFGIYGSKSGYDSLLEAFGEYAKYIFAIESGLSSDPAMNWQIRELDTRSIVSFSDAHSLPKMGREATALRLKHGKSKIKQEDITYRNILNALVKGKERVFELAYTIEYYPEEGKYHYTGHRKCGVSFNPSETKNKGTVCPVCGKELTVGVLHRLEELAKREPAFTYKEDENNVVWIADKRNKLSFVNLVPLPEILAETLSVGVGTQKVRSLYDQMIAVMGSELDILLRSSVIDIKNIAGEKVAKSITKVRKRDIEISPGFDGEYGKVSIWDDEEEKYSSEEQLGFL